MKREKFKRRICLLREKEVFFCGCLIQESKRATLSAIAWAPASFNVWQRVISFCRSLSLLFALDFELRFTCSLLSDPSPIILASWLPLSLTHQALTTCGAFSQRIRPRIFSHYAYVKFFVTFVTKVPYLTFCDKMRQFLI